MAMRPIKVPQGTGTWTAKSGTWGRIREYAALAAASVEKKAVQETRGPTASLVAAQLVFRGMTPDEASFAAKAV